MFAIWMYLLLGTKIVLCSCFGCPFSGMLVSQDHERFWEQPNKSNSFTIHLAGSVSSNLDPTTAAGGLMLQPVWGTSEFVHTFPKDHSRARSQGKSPIHFLLPIIVDHCRPTSCP
jgi:hypothetical protein